MQDPVASAAILGRLRRLGVGVALDDFGAEYSSLAYLKRLPVTMLKIDKSFVDSLLQEDTADASLIAAVVAMAKSLGITTVAEGVESSVQAQSAGAAGRRRRAGLPVLASGDGGQAPRGDRVPERAKAEAGERLAALAGRGSIAAASADRCG